MDERTKQILLGLMLGDGHFTAFYGRSATSALDMKADSRYLPYLQWLHRELAPIGVSELRPKKNYHQHRFYTKRTKEIGELRALFYPEGKKIIPDEIKKLLKSPLSLAVWYQDDGTLDCRDKYHYNALFATHCFSFDECRLLADTLKENFELDVRVAKCRMRNVLRYRLYVVSKSMDRFMELITPYINSCFTYKIRKSSDSQQQR